ncbi:DUF5681 domain-containing protein [uncultured Albimonas sp.]|uniref:DUF5681 domain-containing protein n=1 Tax=uncultured Albimonas sp. TaxID=1331701 RepID=UPI0030EF0E8B
MSERRKKKPQGDYEIGYARPPAESRFKPGQSGNSKGRPKGSKNLSSILEDSLFGPVPVTIGGRSTTVPAIEAIMLRLRIKALEGDLRAIEKVMKVLPLAQAMMDARAEGEAPADAVDLTRDAELLAEFQRMLADGEDAA